MLLGGLFLLLRCLLLLLSLRFGVLRSFLLRRQTLFLQLLQALLLLRLLLLKLFGLLLRLFLALLLGTLRIVALLLLAVVLFHHRARIDHHCAHHGAITATAGAHVDLFLQRSPNQQGNQYEVQNDRNNNGAVQLIVLLSCLYQNRFPKTGVAYTGFLGRSAGTGLPFALRSDRLGHQPHGSHARLMENIQCLDNLIVRDFLRTADQKTVFGLAAKRDLASAATCSGGSSSIRL